MEILPKYKETWPPAKVSLFTATPQVYNNDKTNSNTKENNNKLQYIPLNIITNCLLRKYSADQSHSLDLLAH